MKSSEPISLRLIGLWCLVFISALLTAYFGFIALVSVWVGLGNLDQPGCWVPILVGLLFFIALCYFFLRTLKRLQGHLRSQAAVNISPNSPYVP
jgi:hypothetical protein